MKRSRQTEKPALELLEEAIHLLRAAPIATIATYYLGALPFVLGLLYFWTDMSRSPFASGHLAEGALGIAALFIWMKFWQGVFASVLRARLVGDAAPSLTFSRCRRILFSQIALQPFGLFLLPLALVTVFSFPWIYGFFQTVTARAERETTGVFDFFKKSWREAVLWPGQNLTMLLTIVAFGLYVFFNLSSVCFLLPQILKVLFGVETMFTRSTASMFNTTFFAAMFWLTYLCVDPILKAAYTLRCFYGESRQSGEDLKAELRQFRAGQVLTGASLAIVAFGVFFATERLNFSEPYFNAETRRSQRERRDWEPQRSSRLCVKIPTPEYLSFPYAVATSALQRSDASTLARSTPIVTASDPAPAPPSTPIVTASDPA